MKFIFSAHFGAVLSSSQNDREEYKQGHRVSVVQAIAEIIIGLCAKYGRLQAAS